MDNMEKNYFLYTNEYVNDTYEFYNDTFGNSNVTDEFPNDNVSYAVEVVSMILYTLTCVLGLPGNAFVIWIAGMKMKRTVNTIWFLNLAIADFLCCLSLPFSIVNIALDYHWPYGNVLCKLIPSVIILNMFASVFTLTLISLDRFVLVIKPVWSQNNRRISLAYTLCGIVWLMALFLSLPPLIYRETHYDIYTNTTECHYNYNTDNKRKIENMVHITRFVFGFVIPFFIIIMCYSLIALKVKSSHFAKSKKTLKIVLGVIVAFFICWLPYHITGILIELSTVIDPLVIALAYINSCLNPFLYVFMGHDFKETVRHSLRHVLESAFSEDLTRSTIQSKGKSSRDENSDLHL
ncbi:C3a anaphylatoxin chemotactic receptor [Lepisosteus oculatus]|uniref:Complement C3a receptor 1 n=1 Tax=Lepisosteus oculatus TaxID=7918 RepID=W5NLY7_LEPOC|nr:PREDICTED: C3a anaphylatoxin chemotactic receptor-like [Lepisosteus oculatus]